MPVNVADGSGPEGRDQRASSLAHPLEGPPKDLSITLIRQARCLLAIVLMQRGAPIHDSDHGSWLSLTIMESSKESAYSDAVEDGPGFRIFSLISARCFFEF